MNVAGLRRYEARSGKIVSVRRHKRLDTLVNYGHEVEQGDDPAEAYVSDSNGGGP